MNEEEEVKEEAPPLSPPQEEGVAEPTPELESVPSPLQGEGLSEARAGEEENPNVTIQKSGDTVTISEVMISKEEVSKVPFDTKAFLASLLPKLKEKLNFRTEKRLAKILALAKEKGEIRNDDVEKLLHVSDSTAARYLKKLEGRGQLKNIGNPDWPKYKSN